jgi:hypothetical protein
MRALLVDLRDTWRGVRRDRLYAAAVLGTLALTLGASVRVDTGFAAENAVTLEVAPLSARYPDGDARTRLYDRILDRVRAMPGVTDASWTSALPLTGETFADKILRPDRVVPESAKSSANYGSWDLPTFARSGCRSSRGAASRSGIGLARPRRL